jgi:hypothetical protein
MQAAINTVAHWAERMVTQHGAIGQMEQQQAAGEDEERAIADEFGDFGARLVGAPARHRAVGAFGIDLARRDGA